MSKYEDLVQTLTSAVSSEMKHKVMKRAVLQCPAVPMDLLGREVPSLLNSGSMVTLIRRRVFCQTYPALTKQIFQQDG